MSPALARTSWVNAGAVLFATDAVELFAGFSQGFETDPASVLGQLPTGQDIVNVDLSPTLVDSYQVGVRGTWERLKGSLAAFDNEADSQVVRLPVGDLGLGVANLLNEEYAAFLDQQFRAFGGGSIQSAGRVFTLTYAVRW